MFGLWIACSPDPTFVPQTSGLERLEDHDPAPLRFEGDLTLSPVETWLGEELVQTYAYNGTIPGPLIEVDVGTQVSVTFRNELPDSFANTVHWHGIEGYNASDGTPVTQELVGLGESLEYTFDASRPGLFWYHPHHRGAQLVYSGVYGPLVVRQPEEAALISAGILPEPEQILVLSDTQVYGGEVLSAEVDNAMVQMNGVEGELLLVNGVVRPTFDLPAGSGVRLGLINTSITRLWRVSVPGATLHVIGGEGGLLDAAVVDGGSVPVEIIDPQSGDTIGAGERDLGFDRGEVLLGPGDRLQVVLVAAGAPGDELQLTWKDWARGRHTMAMDGDTMVAEDASDDGLRPAQVAAVFRLVEGGTPFTFVEGQPLLTALGSGVERLPEAADVLWVGENATTLDERMDMWLEGEVWQMSTWFGIDGLSWHPSHVGGASQPFAATARFASLGQVIRWEVTTLSGMAHPFHLHGFSFQPQSVTWWPDPDHDDPGTPALRYRYDGTTGGVPRAAFEDTVVVPGHATVEFLVRLDDPSGDGRAAGRWMEHCHILQHGELGMASELVVE